MFFLCKNKVGIWHNKFQAIIKCKMISFNSFLVIVFLKLIGVITFTRSQQMLLPIDCSQAPPGLFTLFSLIQNLTH